jgi:hypothetical protein
LVIAFIVVESSNFVDVEKKGFQGLKVSEFQGQGRLRAVPNAFVLETLKL